MKRIIHIAPALPPVVNGLGDFCKILASNLGKDGYTDNVFMIRYPPYNTITQNTLTFEAETFSGLLESQKADVVLLHYVGYAYNKRGLPFYLASGLKEHKKKFNSRVLVFFHELYASSTSLFELPFYTNILQRMIVRQLYDIADSTFTNCGLYNEMLKNLVGKGRFSSICTGIFSNIPDDLYDPSIDKDSNSMVVFGSLRRRNLVYENPAFREAIEKLQIKRLYDIGPGEISFEHKGVNTFIIGSLHPAALALYLNVSKFGALSYSPKLLGKSGIFSAYAAFGVIPINLVQTDDVSYDNLTDGKHFCGSKLNGGLDTIDFDGIRAEILTWYRSRSQQAVTEKIKSYL